MNFQPKLKQCIKNIFTNKLIIVCLAYALIYFLSGFCKWLQFANCILAFICFITFTPQQAFCLLLFAHSFTLSFIIYDFAFAVVMISFVFIMFAKYIRGIKKKKYFIHKKLAIIFAILTITSTIISFFFGICPQAILYLIYMPLFYLMFTMQSDLNLRQGVDYLLFGLISSSLLSALGLLIPNYQLSAILQGRFRGYTNNPNNIYQRAIFIITYYIYLYLSNNLSHLKFYSTYAACALITLLSGSKTGLFFLVLFTLLFIIIYLYQDFKKRYKFALLFVLSIAIAGFILKDYLISTLNRFFYNKENLITSILTNRDKIWILYINGWLENCFTFLFGRGMFGAEVFFPLENARVGSHNLYLFILYRFGIVGAIAFAYCIYLIIKHHKDYKFSFISFIPMFWLLLQNMCDNTFRHFNIMYIVFAFMAMFESKKEFKSNRQIKKEKFKNLQRQNKTEN